MVFKKFFCSEFPNIPDDAGKGTRRRRSRRIQAIAKRYAFHANAIKSLSKLIHDITMATSHLTSNELNNLENKIFLCINQLKVWKKAAILIIYIKTYKDL